MLSILWNLMKVAVELLMPIQNEWLCGMTHRSCRRQLWNCREDTFACIEFAYIRRVKSPVDRLLFNARSMQISSYIELLLLDPALALLENPAIIVRFLEQKTSMRHQAI